MTVLVLGGTGGIGQAIVRRYAQNGDDVMFSYLRAEDSAARLALECSSDGARIEPVQLDVRRGERLAEVIQGAGRNGLDSIVLALGSGVPQSTLADFRPRHWDWAFQTNARAVVETFALALPYLERTRGAMTVLTSVGSRIVLPNYAHVGPAKAAMEAAVRYAAWEAGPRGVRVNAISPGLVDTKAVTAYPAYRRRLEDTARQTPLGRLISPEDVAEAVHWLGSSQAAMVTGQLLTVDGGWELACAIE